MKKVLTYSFLFYLIIAFTSCKDSIPEMDEFFLNTLEYNITGPLVNGNFQVDSFEFQQLYNEYSENGAQIDGNYVLFFKFIDNEGLAFPSEITLSMEQIDTSLVDLARGSNIPYFEGYFHFRDKEDAPFIIRNSFSNLEISTSTHGYRTEDQDIINSIIDVRTITHNNREVLEFSFKEGFTLKSNDGLSTMIITDVDFGFRTF